MAKPSNPTICYSLKEGLPIHRRTRRQRTSPDHCIRACVCHQVVSRHADGLPTCRMQSQPSRPVKGTFPLCVSAQQNQTPDTTLLVFVSVSVSFSFSPCAGGEGLETPAAPAPLLSLCMRPGPKFMIPGL